LGFNHPFVATQWPYLTTLLQLHDTFNDKGEGEEGELPPPSPPLFFCFLNYYSMKIGRELELLIWQWQCIYCHHHHQFVGNDNPYPFLLSLMLMNQKKYKDKEKDKGKEKNKKEEKNTHIKLL